MSEISSVVLVGPRAVGKTTLGQKLGAALGWEARDTDDLLAAAVGCPAGVYLAERGEAAFRAAEEPVVLAALAGDGGVLSLGGGAVLAAKVRQVLAHPRHFVVFLSAPVRTLVERQLQGGLRPPLTDRSLAEEVAELYQRREPLYRQVSDLELDTNSANVDGCRDAILANMGSRGG